MKTTVLALLLSLLVGMGMAFRYEFAEEWKLWKRHYGKLYQSSYDDLERHIVWCANKQFIEIHNANADFFGYTLAMNHHADLVSFHACTKLARQHQHLYNANMTACRQMVSLLGST